MRFENCPSLLLVIILIEVEGADDDYNVIKKDGSYEFGYNTPDSYHYADANRNNVVRGEFGGRNPGTGGIDRTLYTAGPRGFRPRGKNVARKYDLNQNGPRPIGSADDPYYDPYEDPSYSFSFATGRYNRKEDANRLGDVTGSYSYTDDVGERHRVDFIAGKNTGFHVKTPFPDSNPRSYGPLYFNGRGKPLPRGRTSIQRGLDGSYRFVSAGPDQRRTETSDSTGHVRGSYTYLDDKGIQHSVHYIAGPETGYRVLKNVKGPHLPTIFPFGRPNIIPPDFYDSNKDTDIFDTAASGPIKPVAGKPGANEEGSNAVFGNENGKDELSFGDKIPVTTSRPDRPSSIGRPGKPTKPSFTDDGDDDFGDLFGGINGGSTTKRPFLPSVQGASSKEDDGSYQSSGEDGSYRPLSDTNRPTPSYGNDFIPRPGESNIGSTSSPHGSSGGGKPGGTTGNDFGNTGYGKEKPTPGFNEGYNSNEVGDDFGLFGSESSNSRPPYGGGAVITVGTTAASCGTCKGTIVTNVGDTLFTVPPGVSVRAHVQSIDLLPVIPTVPSPSEQYKAEISFKTEQLNKSSDDVVSANTTNSIESTATDSTVITTIIPSSNSTDT
ncbi:hypothetical protein NQ317_016490 [Molorchus minor]|uniref:Uncharacterized protein n=1 Tax=Molorchus minor TaxID=1323400 RepID=A0ABQ9JF87_9CUCU|nr:hypothetical protein NQ317_016490 [Molorchus minor]